ncbi:prepilin peptidase [Sphingomonas sp. BN140010]|uniref:Prepilin peptidase n=1 Tax=Sphingomonas arvum TaxID=2992113 RepID=A0ABT3JEE2_9SPHN|nr:prepilin peptidase [Sphingomonas sp. BN140010]MCW3797186.1 prepilin peptidase [Sphingomonas sp. BN140010]
MNLLNTVPAWLAILLSALLVAAAVQDILVRKISNLLVLAVLAAGIAAMVMVGPQVRLWQNFLVFAVLLGLGVFAYAGNKLGAGDVKLFAATALWVDLKGAPWLIAAILISGGVLALLMLAKVLIGPAAQSEGMRKRRSVPYGVAIAAGALLILWYGRVG